MNVLNHAETTMTPEEAEAIVARVMNRVEATASGPSVAEVAAALRLSPDEVARMLADLRGASRKRPRRKSSRRERRVWMLSGVVALVLAGIGITGTEAMRGISLGPLAFRRHVMGVQGKGAYTIFFNGAPTGFSSYVGNDPSKLLSSRFEGWVETNLPRFRERDVSPSVEKAYRQAIIGGRWDDAKEVTVVTLEVRKGDVGDRWLRWAKATVPIYDGDDALILEGVRKERERRMRKAVASALKGI